MRSLPTASYISDDLGHHVARTINTERSLGLCHKNVKNIQLCIVAAIVACYTCFHTHLSVFPLPLSLSLAPAHVFGSS